MQDLDHAKWAEIPRDAYVAAARYLVQHNPAYQHLSIDEACAREQFMAMGATCAAVRAQACSVAAEAAIPAKLSGPADLPEETGPEISVGEADVQDPAELEHGICDGEAEQEIGPGFHCAAADVSSADLDVERCCKELAAKVLLLMQRKSSRTGDTAAEVEDLKTLAASLSQAELQHKLSSLVAAMDEAEGRAEADSEPGLRRVQIVYTGTTPLSMYQPEYWQKCFPELFPYGDGVFGLPRDTALTFREWAAYLLERVELEYDVCSAAELEPQGDVRPHAIGEDQAAGAQGDGRPDEAQGDARLDGEVFGFPSVSAAPVDTSRAVYQPPSIPRWSGDLNFVAVANDTWKRMELVRSASGHVRRRKFKESLRVIMDCTSDKLSDAVCLLGEKAGLADVMRSARVDAGVKEALSELMFFSSEVVGSDGARQQLRHEQNGAMLLRGGIDGFLTPNVADVRNPLMVVLHNGCVKAADGGWEYGERITGSCKPESFLFTLQDVGVNASLNLNLKP